MATTKLLIEITIDCPLTSNEGQVQDEVLQHFPEVVAGHRINFIQAVAGMVDLDGVATMARV